ncbi:MAG: phosphopentomutase [Clostridia bacterium]|nr:phosphopentomutase [Clostridia bacterium]
MKRAFLIVLDSFGIGELPDAHLFGDRGANTLGSISRSEKLRIPNLISLGLGNIDGVNCIEKADTPLGVFAKCEEKSMGKDTTVGHWEIAGLISENPMPTYSNGFDKEIIEEFEKRTGKRVICNKPYSGTEVIYDYGREHTKTGALIVYTSADSVFQIAAHEDVVPLDELYSYCKTAREMLVGKWAVGRVIARPFIGEFPNYKRTSARRDFSLEPTGKTVLDALKENNFDVISVGKINDIFASRGITEKYKTHSNLDGINKTIELMSKDFCGLCFTNLVDFDMIYGHRNDIDGYASALSEFDMYLPRIMSSLRDDDLLIITADHGCDPGDTSTDHTREYVPLLIYKKEINPKNLGILPSYSVIASTIAEFFGIDYKTNYTGILKNIN